ncbi:hypothetical protein N5K37_29880 [Delftia tsuruhatensis]|uniref:hypothetical protein n=1 Tax=Delftia TaxID=80865 RepID=UPI002447CB68|nr:hypothetical protein [Delftia tsuruhatensis]MDH2234131.1 hypothetical protein [Delftia tsuruhatensis]
MEIESLMCVSTAHPDIVKPVRGLACCCCGGSITGRQFHNQDTGHGLGDCCVEFVKPRTEDMERTYGVEGVHYLLDPLVLVRESEARGWTKWRISLRLTDRCGLLNTPDPEKRPAFSRLQSDPVLLRSLQAQMPWNVSSIVRKDGVWGILFEVPFATVESETGKVDPQDPWYLSLPLQEEKSNQILSAFPKLAYAFPGVLFAVPDREHVELGRTTAWAFVPHGLLDAMQRFDLIGALRQL